MGKHRISLGIFLISFSVLLPVTNYIYTTTVNVYDSTETVSDDDVSVKGYAWFRQGITLSDTGAGPYTLTMATPLPVGGNIELDGGTLLLNEDLHLADGAGITSSNQVSPTASTFSINGNGRTIYTHGSTPFSASDMAVTITGETVIDGGGCTLLLGSNFSFVVNNNAQLTLRNMTIIGADDSFITINSTTGPYQAGTVVFENVDWHLVRDNSGSFVGSMQTFDRGDIYFKGKNNVYGNGGTLKFATGSSQTINIFLDGTIAFHDGTTFTLDATQSMPNLTCEATTASLCLIGATFSIPSGTFAYKTGSFIAAATASIEGNLDFGDGASADNNAYVIVRPGGKISVDNGTLAFKDYTP